MATDRELFKLQQLGGFTTFGASDPREAVEEVHEETFFFTTFAAAPYVEQGIHMKKKCRVKQIRIVSATTLSADATNNITATVAKRDGAGGAAATIGAVTTDVAGGALTAFVPKTVSITVANQEIAADAVLTFKTADNGTTTEPLLTCSITVEYV
jgi:hypothetical protein